jgi:hypothetical protein
MVRAGADIDEPRWFFDQCRQNVGCQHINGEDAGNSRLALYPPLAIADACVVDDRIKTTEVVDLVGNGPRPADGREISRDDSLGAGCRRKSVATSTVIPSVQQDVMALLDQEPGRHQTEAVR